MPFKILIITCIIGSSLSVSQAVLAPDDVYFHGMEADRMDWSRHPCNRPCVDGAAPRTCHYLFVVESYMSMSKACYDCPRNLTDCYRPHCLPADGKGKPLTVADRNLPGPHIQVCLGDKIVVDVRNMLDSAATAIHWHGIRQIESPYMDGVPFVTQCPILPRDTFRYQFKADQSGTYFWHSHSGGQRADGLFGGLTIRSPPKLNPHRSLYDFDEHSAIVLDWKPESGDDFLTKNALFGNENANTSTLISSILVNGLGRLKNSTGNNDFPIPVFNVKRGFRYRFRMVNAGAENCPIAVSVDNHTITVISADGYDVDPLEVDSIQSWSGERYDFVLNADKEIGNYWIRFRGYSRLCNKPEIADGKVYQVAILRYESAALENPKSPVGWDIVQHTFERFRELNPYNLTVKPELPITALKSLAANDKTTGEKVDQQFYVSYDSYEIDNYQTHRSGLYGYKQILARYPNKAVASLQFNHVSFKPPPFPVLPQRSMITPGMFCNGSTLADKDCEKDFCACTQVVQVKLNSVVELVVVDEGKYSEIYHAMHLHGYSFRVVAIESLGKPTTVDEVKQLDREGKINRTLDRPPVKDTLRIPYGGYAILRFYANNPGYWFFHCHFDEHANSGMALVFKVGEDDDMLPVPKNFPQCGNYVPKIM